VSMCPVKNVDLSIIRNDRDNTNKLTSSQNWAIMTAFL